jgi:hypothetical protein
MQQKRGDSAGRRRSVVKTFVENQACERRACRRNARIKTWRFEDSEK